MSLEDFRVWYLANLPALLQFAREAGEDAGAVVQVVFVRLYRRFVRGECPLVGDEERFRQYMRKAVRNGVIDWQRRRATQARVERERAAALNPDAPPAPEAGLVLSQNLAECREVLRGAVELLSPARCRALLGRLGQPGVSGSPASLSRATEELGLLRPVNQELFDAVPRSELLLLLVELLADRLR